MVRIWTKILTALSGAAHQSSTALLADQALNILEQEIREAEGQVAAARSCLASLIAKSMMVARDAAETETRLSQMIDHARLALAAGREDLALEAAAKVCRLEQSLAQDQRIAREYEANVQRLREAMQSSEEKLQALSGQVDLLRSTEAVQQIRKALSTGTSGTTHLQAAADALDGIRRQQQETDALLQAQQEVALYDNLEQRLREAQVIPDPSTARSVLERITANSVVRLR